MCSGRATYLLDVEFPMLADGFCRGQWQGSNEGRARTYLVQQRGLSKAQHVKQSSRIFKQKSLTFSREPTYSVIDLEGDMHPKYLCGRA
jgi:hypothetical protein